MTPSTDAHTEMPSLKGKRAIISGGTTGIGRAIAVLLASEGVKVFVCGREQDHLDDALARIREVGEGEDHVVVATRMVEALAGHDLLASAPSWDGKWLSALLREGGQPRRVLRLRDSDEAQLEAARACLAVVEPAAVREALAREVVGEVSQRRNGRVPDHRALADAVAEREQWLEVQADASRRAGLWVSPDAEALNAT